MMTKESLASFNFSEALRKYGEFYENNKDKVPEWMDKQHFCIAKLIFDLVTTAVTVNSKVTAQIVNLLMPEAMMDVVANRNSSNGSTNGAPLAN